MLFAVRWILVLCSVLCCCHGAAMQQSMESLMSRLSNISDSSCSSSSLNFNLDLINLMRLVALDAQKSPEISQPSKQKENLVTSYYQSTSLNLVELGGRKYFFSDQKANFFDAMTFCRAYGMELASIETAEENTLLIDHYYSSHTNDEVAYISGHDIGRGTFAWNNGDPITFSFWDTNEPDSKTQNCMCFYRKKWHNTDCSHVWLFICEQL